MSARIWLLSAAIFAVLVGTAVSGEEPPATPAAATEAGQEDSRAQWGYVPGRGAVYTEQAYKEILLGLVALAFFLAGLWQHRHDWKPLIIGLFACALGLLDASLNLMDGLAIIASKSGQVVGAELAEALARSLISFNVGLVVLMATGLFTLVLRSRNERIRKTEASPDEAEAAEQDQD